MLELPFGMSFFVTFYITVSIRLLLVSFTLAIICILYIKWLGKQSAARRADAGRGKVAAAARRGVRRGRALSGCLSDTKHECEPFAKPFAKPLAKPFTKLAHANQARAQKALDSTSPHP